MNTFGRIFKLSIFGESHGEAIGVVLDGVPAGIALSKDDFIKDISRRKSGGKGTTPRIEADEPHILSGIFNGHTTGAPLAIIFENTNTRSGDYSQFLSLPRPGHADLVAAQKWNSFNDPRGGGHFSGRITLPIVAAGVVAKKMLDSIGIVNGSANLAPSVAGGVAGGVAPEISAEVVQLGGLNDPNQWTKALDKAAAEGDSLGAIVKCIVSNPPLSVGEPFFDSVESLLSHALFSIPGVRGVEFGDGFSASSMSGSEHNDPIVESSGKTLSNHSGGINGGIANGNPLEFKVAFKPTSTINKNQSTLNLESGSIEELKGKGRHDLCFALRTPVIVEAMAAIVLADLSLVQTS